jgi:SRSO17 transposase
MDHPVEGLSMERRFEIHKDRLLSECEVKPGILQGILSRLRSFAQPFLAQLRRREQKQHAEIYLSGLVSDLECKNVESIAYLHDQERHRLQAFVGESEWEHRPLLCELALQVGQELGESDGVIVFDPSGFPKSGAHSAGVARQWCGRLGKVDNCQVAVYMGYVSRVEHALVNVRLYLPKSWAGDKVRRKNAGIPPAVRFQTRHAQALEMLAEVGHLLPHGWIAGDDEMGRSTRFRRDLSALGERYMLAVPSNTSVRDLEGERPAYGGRGAVPQRAFEQVRAWVANVPAEKWQRIDVRDAHRGPLVVEAVKTRVVAKTEGRRIGPEETLVVLRAPTEDGTLKYDYYLSNASFDTPLREFARVAKAEHRIEECIQRGKSEAGLADYEVRTWSGWHHHQTLALIATWFLVQETRRGKKIHSGVDGPASADRACGVHQGGMRFCPAGENRTKSYAPLGANGPRPVLPMEKT